MIDSEDILRAPEAALRALCKAIGLDFAPQMLHWPKGGHKDDGAWASHWYGSVWQSTGFGKASAKPILSPKGRALAELAQPYFDHLAKHKLEVPGL